MLGHTPNTADGKRILGELPRTSDRERIAKGCTTLLVWAIMIFIAAFIIFFACRMVLFVFPLVAEVGAQINNEEAQT